MKIFTFKYLDGLEIILNDLTLTKLNDHLLVYSDNDNKSYLPDLVYINESLLAIKDTDGIMNVVTFFDKEDYPTIFTHLKTIQRDNIMNLLDI